MARNWAKKYNNIIMICGRYEGVDARVKKIFKAEKFLSANIFLRAGNCRGGYSGCRGSPHPGVLGKEESLEEERGMSGFPVYTKPEVFEFEGKKNTERRKSCFPAITKKIKNWRKKMAL